MSFLVLKAYLKLIYFDLYLARGDFAALYDKVRKLSSKSEHVRARCDRMHQLCHRHGLHLVLEGSALPATLRGHSMSAQEVRRAGTDGHRCATDAVQGTRMGRS